MNILRTSVSLIILFTIISCKRPQSNTRELAERFSALECRAIAIREKRFALADEIRFTEDTLLLQENKKTDTKQLKLKLAALNENKAVLLQQSLALADTIKKNLAELMNDSLKNESDKTAFNNELNDILLKKGCIKK